MQKLSNHLGTSRITLPTSRHIWTHVVEYCLKQKKNIKNQNQKGNLKFNHTMTKTNFKGNEKAYQADLSQVLFPDKDKGK